MFTACGLFEQRKFQSQNVSELKSNLGHSLSDYVNHFTDGGEQWTQGPEEVTTVPELLLQITEPVQLHS